MSEQNRATIKAGQAVWDNLVHPEAHDNTPLKEAAAYEAILNDPELLIEAIDEADEDERMVIAESLIAAYKADKNSKLAGALEFLADCQAERLVERG